MQTFWIPGVCPGMNEIIAASKSGHGNRNAYSRMKKEVMGKIYIAIKAKDIKPMKSAHIEIQWHERNKRRDADNISAGKKFICDALVEAGVLKNDTWKYIDGFTETFYTSRKGEDGVVVILNGEGR